VTVAVATALVAAVALTAVYLFLYLQDRERFLGLWTIAWAFNAVRYLAELTAVAWSDSGVWEPVSHTAGLIVAGLLVAGARTLAEGGSVRSRILVFAVAAGALWAWGAWLAGASFLVASMPVRALMGVGFLWAGHIVWRARILRGVGRPVVAVAFLLWGIHKLDYPFLRPVGWFAPWGFGLSAVFEIIVAFGIMVVYFEKVRSQAEARFSALFEENLCVMALVDEESGLIVDANPAACAFYGYGRDQFRGMHVRALNEHPDAEWRPLVIPDARASRAPFRFRNRLASGAVREVETYYTLVEVGGRILQHVIVHDITERVRAQRDLVASEERFRLLAENAHDFIFRFRLTGQRGFEYASPAAEAVLGFTPQQLYEDYSAAFERVHPGDRAEVARIFRGKGGDTAADPIRLRRPDGEMVWTEARLTVVRDGAGEPVTLEGIVRDVTPQRHKDEEIRRLLSALEQMAEVVVVTDVAGDIVYVNPAFERVTGYVRDEALGRNPRFLKSGRQGEGFYRELWDTILSGSVWSGRFTNLKKSGDTYEEEVTISPVRDAEGSIVSFVAVKRDITRELVLEEQLVQSQKLEAVGRLAGGIAHDFNNLLTTIGGYADILAGTLADGDPRSEDLAEIKQAADRAGDLTRRLLAFSRREVVRPEPVDVGRTVAGMASMLRRMIGGSIELVTELAPGPLVVIADPGQVEQVVMNLVLNAADAMPEGGMAYVGVEAVELDSTAAAVHGVEASGAYARLTVRDTGSGMDEEVRLHLFEPFFTTKAPDRGSGLGLATVYGIVEATGGSVGVVSAPGEGSEFEVLLPLRDIVPVSQRQPLRAAVARPAGIETILVVEDEPGVRRLTVRTLRGLGYEVLEAEGSGAALDILASDGERIRLVVTDVVMPHMSGVQLAQRIGRDRPDLNVVLVSGYANGAIGDGESGEWRYFLPKPFTADELSRMVREALDATPGVQQP